MVGGAARNLSTGLVFAIRAAQSGTCCVPQPWGSVPLFYLRSIAPPSIKSSDILMGSIPRVFIMLIMVGLVIAFPQMVSLSVQIFGRF